MAAPTDEPGHDTVQVLRARIGVDASAGSSLPGHRFDLERFVECGPIRDCDSLELDATNFAFAAEKIRSKLWSQAIECPRCRKVGMLRVEANHDRCSIACGERRDTCDQGRGCGELSELELVPCRVGL